MPRRTLILILMLTLFAGTAAAQDVQIPHYEPMHGCFTDITIDLDYECGYVTVPEFYDGRTDRTLRLAVVRIFAVGAGEPNAPIFFMDGGPGGSLLINLGLDQFAISQESGMADDPEAATPVLDMLATRDFVLFSQRGTQFSEPALVCEEDNELRVRALELDFEAQRELARELLQSCVDAYAAEGVDLNAYTNFANADDVNAVREALGYDQIIFYGESYGAQLGQHVMQRHPDILEAAILDGVNSVSKVEWTQDLGPVLEQGINTLLMLCAEDELCADKLGNPESLLVDAFARVQEAPVMATYTAADGSSYQIKVTPEVLAITLETIFVDSSIRPSIPLMLAELRDGDASRMAATIGDEATDTMEEDAFVAELMHQAMVCSDDPPQIEASYDTSGYSAFALFTEQVGALQYVDGCEILDLEQLPDSSDIDVTVNVPTLILGGGLDVRTPIFRNQEVADRLPNSRLITFEYSDHVQYRGDFAPCAAAIVSAFVVNPTSLNDLDASCTATAIAPPTLKLPPLVITDIIGTEFVFTGIYAASSEEFVTPPEGGNYSITFMDAENLTINADCNAVNASYVAGEDDAISIELGASTMVACPEGSIADDFLAVIESSSSISIIDAGELFILLLEAEDSSNVGFNAPR